MSCDQVRLSLGAYALETLEPAERAEVDDHLFACPVCAAELSELETLPPLLDLLRLEEVLEDPDAVVALRFRVQVRLLAAAAVVVLLVGAGVATFGLTRTSPSSYRATTQGITMAVTVTAVSSGSHLAVSVAGLPEHEHCRLVALSRRGTRAPAGTWTASYNGQATVYEGTTIRPRDLAGFVLFGTHGEQLVAVRV